MDEQPEDFGVRMPLLDMFENGKEWVFELELPGVNEKTISVVLLEHSVVVTAERMEPYSKEDVYVFQERHFVKYFRSIPLPEGMKTAKMTAYFISGILRVIVPKGPRAKETHIKVRTAP